MDSGGPKEDRTPDLRIANAALSQLSYRPVKIGIVNSNGGFGKKLRFCLAIFARPKRHYSILTTCWSVASSVFAFMAKPSAATSFSIL